MDKPTLEELKKWAEDVEKGIVYAWRWPTHRECITMILDARRRIAELERDAERYRAIRAGKWAIRQGQTIVQIDKWNYAYPLGTGGDLDSAVDTVIAAQRQKEGE